MQSDYDADAIAWAKSILDYDPLHGTSLAERCFPYGEYIAARRALGTWWTARVLMSKVSHQVLVADEYGANVKKWINFGSHDYLSLSSHESVKDATKKAIEQWGVHSAGSPVLIGRTGMLLELEAKISLLLRREATTLYATGWAAGFGVMTGLIRPHDEVVMDVLAHNCLHQGARHATPNVKRFGHNNLDQLDYLLGQRRKKNRSCGLFVVLESLYSMDSDSPNLQEAIKIVRRHDGILILDVAHDFGAMGVAGLGLLESIDLDEGPDIIMGSFSKTFAANGGFVASTTAVKDYLTLKSATYAFSNAMSPLQTAIISQCFHIVFSEKGSELRQALAANINLMRKMMTKHGLFVGGTPSPIVPVYVGDEILARLTYRNLSRKDLLANLVEYPGVPRGKARFRFQMMSSHDSSDIVRACKIMADSRRIAAEELQ